MPKDIIQLLPDSIANQIAAGEVVQRPASVVKELLENAVDAQATEIRVIIKEAGKSLIQVMDNGSGMSESDTRMCFERHATSKIKKSEDLFTVRTMGFRGEALASMAAVAQVDLKSRQEENELGTNVLIEASKFKSQQPVAFKTGTSISVKNLFYNVPARRNFLKSNPVETRHIIDEFQRIALSHPEISISLFQDDLEVYSLDPGKLSSRIVQIFGKNYKQQLASCTEETPLMRVHGYIGKPEFSRKTRGEQFFFANGRFIKSPYLNHAVLNAYEGLIQDNSFPFYVLFIEIDPKHIDINVHPTKTEIKFDDERTIYAIIRSAVKQSLSKHNIAPSIKFDTDVNFQNMDATRLDFRKESFSSEHRGKIGEKANLENWEKLYERTSPEESIDQSQGKMIFQSKMNDQSARSEKRETSKPFQLHQNYIIYQIKSGMMILDQQASHERILYEKYLNALKNKSGASQQTLFPQNISLNSADFALVMELHDEITALGFIFSEFGKDTIIIHGVPADAMQLDEKQLFEGLIEQFKLNKDSLSLNPEENLARSMAKRTCIKCGSRLTEEEMTALIDTLFACANPNYAPNGNKTFHIFELENIASFFN
jgi:DNA mismatch repair protein MutL